MSERVTMPALGESVTEGTVTRWLKNVGDRVEVDEPLLEVSTDKVDTEIPSPVAGVVEQILVAEDDTAPVGADLAVIGDGSGAQESGSQDSGAQQGGSAAEKAKESEHSEPETAQTVAETTQDAPSTEQAAPKAASGDVTGGEKVTMPALGESVTEGTVTRWLKAEGDDVEVDEPLLEVSTDKVDTEIPSPVAGKLTKILVAEDETAPVGADLAIIGGQSSAGEQSAPQQEAKAEQPAKPEPSEKAEPSAKPAPQSATEAEAPAQEVPEDLSARAAGQQPAPDAPVTDHEMGTDASAYVTPLVRKIAAEKGIDLATVTGTGVGGRIRKQDVLEAAEKATAPAASAAAVAPAAPAATKVTPSVEATAKRGTQEKMSRLRKVIAERMVESLHIAAQLTAVVEVDMTRVATLRARAKDEFAAREGVKLTYLPFVAQATVETLKAFPSLNASVEGDEITYHASENLGIAVDTPRGLLVPVIKDAGDLNIAGLARKIADLAERTRTNKVGPDELGGGTFTITNIGSNGTLIDTPIINQPNVAILGTGAMVKRPVVVTDADGNDAIAIRQMMHLVLTYDHRVVDGADAGRFLSALKARLEEGLFEAGLDRTL